MPTRGPDWVDDLPPELAGQRALLPGLAQAHERIFAQFADRSQVDLVLFPASVPGGSVPDVVVLYDPDDLLVDVGSPGPAERGTGSAVAALGRRAGRARSAARPDQHPGLRA